MLGHTVIDALDGISVLEVSTMAFVPSAAAILSDWGADVIKVEEPRHGDLIRGSTANGIAPSGWRDDFNMMWESPNRGKRSIGLDLTNPEAHAFLCELVKQADVFMTNFLPRTRDKLGIDSSTVRALNPRVIYALGSGYGTKGVMAERGGFDIAAFWHRTGMSLDPSRSGLGEPGALPCPGFGDNTSGMALAGGVAAALLRRERTGEGGTVDVSLFSAGLWSTQTNLVASDLLGQDSVPRPRREDVPNPLVQTYRSKEGRYVALCMTQSERYWPGLCRALRHQELLDDPRLSSAEARDENSAYCVARLDEIFSLLTTSELSAALNTQDGPWDLVQLPGEVLRDEQVSANNLVQQVDYGAGRRIRLVSSPVQFDGLAPELRPAPTLGEHTEEILLEFGRSWDEVSALKDCGAIT